MTMLSRRIALLGASALVIGVATPAVGQARRWRRRNRDSGASQAPHQRHSVGAHERQVYDLYDTGGHGPILAYVHGGGWSQGAPTMVHALPDYARRHDLILASIGYRLVPEVTPREQAMDVAAAIADLGRRYPGRPIYLLGHSAGAHLAALVGVDPRYLAVHRLTPSSLAGVILLDGAGYDATGDRGTGPAARILGQLYERAFGNQAAALSPTLLVQPGRAYAPFLIFYIASRSDARAQSEGLAQALSQSGVRVAVEVAADDSHREINVGFGQPGDPQGERSARFIATKGD